MMDFYALARPFLFALAAEKAHDIALMTLANSPCLLPKLTANGDPVKLCGLTFKNRLGLAAGLDKNGVAIAAWQRLNLGHIELGTVTPRPQDGNSKPRLFRLPEHNAIINRMGFNNQGVKALVERVKKVAPSDTLIGINISKNKDTPNAHALDDYILGLNVAYEAADYLTINISSPNTAGLRDLQYGEALLNLLNGLKTAQQECFRKTNKLTPLFVKIAPDNSPEELQQIIHAIEYSQIDGVIATNTTISRTAIANHQYANEAGGLSGAPLTQLSTAIIRNIRQALPHIPLIASGGVMTVEDAQNKLDAGADLVQVYSGFIYGGVNFINQCLRIKK